MLADATIASKEAHLSVLCGNAHTRFSGPNGEPERVADSQRMFI